MFKASETYYYNFILLKTKLTNVIFADEAHGQKL